MVFADELREYLKDKVFSRCDGWGSLHYAKKFLTYLIEEYSTDDYANNNIYHKLNDDFERTFDIPRKLQESSDRRMTEEAAMESNPKNADLQRNYINASQAYIDYLVLDIGFSYLKKHIEYCLKIAKELLNDVENWISIFDCAEKASNDAMAAMADIRKGWRYLKLHEYITEHDDETEKRLFEILTNEKYECRNKIDEKVKEYIKTIDMRKIMRLFNWDYRDNPNQITKQLVCSLPEFYTNIKEVQEDPKKWNFDFVKIICDTNSEIRSIKDLTIGDLILFRDCRTSSEAEMKRVAEEVASKILKESSYLSQIDHGNGSNASKILYMQNSKIYSNFKQNFEKVAKVEASDSLDSHKIILHQLLFSLSISDFEEIRDSISKSYYNRAFDREKIVTKFSPLHNFLGERLASILEVHFDLIGEETRPLDISIVKELDNSRAVMTLASAFLEGLLDIDIDARRGRIYKWNGRELGTSLLDALRTLSNNQDKILDDLDNKIHNYENKILNEECGKDFKKMAERLVEKINSSEELKIDRKNISQEEDFKRVLKIILLLIADDYKNPERPNKYRDVL